MATCGECKVHIHTIDCVQTLQTFGCGIDIGQSGVQLCDRHARLESENANLQAELQKSYDALHVGEHLMEVRRR